MMAYDDVVEKNARIKGTMLGTEDHGILTCYIHLDYGGAGQSFGGYSLDGPIKDDDGKHLRREGSAYGMEFVNRVMETVGVSKWENLPGTPVRVRASYGRVEAIGHFIEDKWFTPEKDLAYLVED